MEKIEKLIELDNRLKKVLNMADVNVSGMLECLRELAAIKEEWNKTYGFEDKRDLSINRNDANSLRLTADFFKWLANYR